MLPPIVVSCLTTISSFSISPIVVLVIPPIVAIIGGLSYHRRLIFICAELQG